MNDYFSADMSLEAAKRKHILKVIDLCGGNRTRASIELEISIRGLRDYLRRYQEMGFNVPCPCRRRHVSNCKNKPKEEQNGIKQS